MCKWRLGARQTLVLRTRNLKRSGSRRADVPVLEGEAQATFTDLRFIGGKPGAYLLNVTADGAFSSVPSPSYHESTSGAT